MRANLRYIAALVLVAAFVALAVPAVAEPSEPSRSDMHAIGPNRLAAFVDRLGDWIEWWSLKRLWGSGGGAMDPNGEPGTTAGPESDAGDTGQDGGGAMDPNG